MDRLLDFDKESCSGNYYKILGCSENSSIEQINTEYKIRALQFHPDKSKDGGAVEAFAKLQRAKEVLSDKELRAEYDKWLRCGIACMNFEEWVARKDCRVCHWTEAKKLHPMICHHPDDGQNQIDKLTRRDIIQMFRNYDI